MPFNAVFKNILCPVDYGIRIVIGGTMNPLRTKVIVAVVVLGAAIVSWPAAASNADLFTSLK